MKTFLTTLWAFMLLGSALTISCVFPGPDEIAIAFHDTPKVYCVDARYNKAQTPSVNRYLDSCFARQQVLRAHITVESSAGVLHIRMIKAEHSGASIATLKQICSHIPFVKKI